MAKMDRITAEQEFDKWAASWELNFKKGMDDEETRSSFDAMKERIVDAFERGRMIFEDDALRYTTSEGNEFVLKEPRGAAFTELDQGKRDDNVHKINKFLGAVTEKSAAVFTKIPGRDWKVFQAFFVLFTNG